MSAPRVFKGREEEVTMEQLVAFRSTAKASSASGGSGDEDISIIKSDITSSSPRPVVETKKRKVGRPPKVIRAAKKLRLAESPELGVRISKSAVPSAENSSSSPCAIPDSPSLTKRKVHKFGQCSQDAPDRRATSVIKMQPSVREFSESGNDANVHDCDANVKGEAVAEPVSTPKGRGRPRKIQTPIPVNKITQDSVRTTRATTRNGSEKAAPAQASKAKVSPAKRASRAYGQGVGRPKKTPRKGNSGPQQFTKKEYIVEKIVNSRIDPITRDQMYMVKWKGYGAKDNTWEPLKNLGKCTSLIKTFTNSQNSKGRGKGKK
ncbi:putative chromo domain-containing protein [Colletotrichum sublineola]|uniref:Putative chromo domain-containing protein n=1 Tax=Colletotrichum sublineola TaxID=1173701 RepID=A0A066X6D9_COLSU|nr:putative chromo domain-containing protein [Colletotrichum sublineola]